MQAARTSGINVKRHLIIVYSIAGLLAGLASGVGRITRTVIGALLLGVMASGFTFVGVDAYLQDIIKVLIIVVAVVIDQYRNKRKLKR